MDSITVYCVKPIADQRKSEFVNPVTVIYKQPSMGKIASIHYSLKFLRKLIQYAIYKVFLPALGMLSMSNASTPSLTGGYCDVLGKWGSYAYIEIKNENVTVDGFVRYTRLDTEIRDFLNISATDINVWANGISDPNKKLTSSYKGEINWVVSNPTVISYDKTTGQITGLKPGTATITATANGMTRVCTVHSIYRWPLEWTAEITSETNLYSAKGTGYTTSKVLSVGNEITICGDDGSDDGWAYGKATIAGEVCWGFVPISHISTKGTISQYRNLNWTWPVLTPENKNKANFITSPYGERDRNPTMHKGIDITTGIPGEIKGYPVVSAFNGEVIYTSNEENSSTGYCVGIIFNQKDPVSREAMIAFYMHLNKVPCVEYGQKVSQGELLGYVGNSGNSGGYHLHFEVNNKSASIEDESTARNYYAYLINPLFFFTDYTNNYVIGVEADKRKEGNENKIIIDKQCSTVLHHNGPYWYGDDKKED